MQIMGTLACSTEAKGAQQCPIARVSGAAQAATAIRVEGADIS